MLLAAPAWFRESHYVCLIFLTCVYFTHISLFREGVLFLFNHGPVILQLSMTPHEIEPLMSIFAFNIQYPKSVIWGKCTMFPITIYMWGGSFSIWRHIKNHCSSTYSQTHKPLTMDHTGVFRLCPDKKDPKINQIAHMCPQTLTRPSWGHGETSVEGKSNRNIWWGPIS